MSKWHARTLAVQVDRMPAVSPVADQQTLGLILAGSGLLFLVEPAISLTSAATYRAINQARREKRTLILWPVGLVMLIWGVICLWASIPPRQAAQWCLLLIALPCLGKGLATIFFSARLARLSEDVEAKRQARRFNRILGIIIGAVLVGWGLCML